MRISHLAVSLCTAGLIMAPELRAEKTQERLQEATKSFNEIAKKGIPRKLLNDAHCAIIVPGLKKGAFVIGGQYGKGFVTCRQAGGAGWSAPAAIRMEGGSVGFQVGGQITDLFMLVMNERGKDRLMKSKFTLGGDASVAAGPVGRDVAAKTDALMTAEILAWSHTGGVFAGVSLSGSTLRPDEDENAELYGRKMTTKEALVQPPPLAAQPLLTALKQYSGAEEGSAADRAAQPAPKNKPTTQPKP